MDQVVMKHWRTTLERAEKFISPRYFTDVNLKGRLYPKSHPVSSLTHWTAPFNKYTPYEEAVNQVYCAVKLGQQFGPTWGTHWFHVVVEIPADWVGQEVKLRWNSGSEALVWMDGKPIQGLSATFDRLDFPLTEAATAENLSISLYIEMACNEMFGAGENGMIQPTNNKKYFTLGQCEIAVFDRKVYNLLMDIELLYDMAKHLGEASERGYQALYTVNDVINACDVNDPTTFDRCHEIANQFLHQKNGSSQHTTYAMGHAHIDTAWLWPYSETKRKCARSWSCTLRLLEKYPDFIFTCSQAQQYEWVKQQYPEMYADIQKFVKEGRFVPVGGTWVEMDGLVPSGEAFIRQFLYGQSFFKEEFGITCTEFWLPDTFGYSAQLPQIMRHCGISRFLTQKLSWSLFNKFPHHTFVWESLDSSTVLSHFPPGDSYKMKATVEEHHTFWWEGIDQSHVLAHFPPGDSYEMKGRVEELLKTVKNFTDKGRSDKTAFLFGFGDGGNGPSEDMLERLQRMKDVDGLPKVKMGSPDEFFSKIEEEDSARLCRWVGELYLELHNGTYTTHARVKKMNRKCELLLQDVEFVSCMARFQDQTPDSGSAQTYPYPRAELARLWKLLMLNQFHDVLPGTSITKVYEDAHTYYNDIWKTGSELLHKACKVTKTNEESNGHVIWNTRSWQRSEVVSIATKDNQPPKDKKTKTDCLTQTDHLGNALYCVTVGSYGYTPLIPVQVKQAVLAEYTDTGGVKLKNDCVEAFIDSTGRVTSMSVKGLPERNAISSESPANQFVLYDDIPLYWDAWDVMDYHLQTRKPITQVTQKLEIIDEGPLRATVKVQLKISATSSIEQLIQLDVGSPYLKFITKVDWHENRKFLKVEFPTSIHTREATYDIQFGHLKRPNHFNTSWDSARFEVCGHKWSDLSEYGYGVSVLNDCKYGHSAVGNVLRMSLLRSPKAPDAGADMEIHNFTYALMPHTGSLQDAQVNQHAYNLNCPLYVMEQPGPSSSLEPQSFFSIASPQVVLETVKLREKSDNELVLRVYESAGGVCHTYVTTSLPVKRVLVCNGLEETSAEPDAAINLRHEGSNIHFNIKPFQILSLILQL